MQITVDGGQHFGILRKYVSRKKKKWFEPEILLKSNVKPQCQQQCSADVRIIFLYLIIKYSMNDRESSKTIRDKIYKVF